MVCAFTINVTDSIQAALVYLFLLLYCDMIAWETQDIWLNGHLSLAKSLGSRVPRGTIPAGTKRLNPEISTCNKAMLLSDVEQRYRSFSSPSMKQTKVAVSKVKLGLLHITLSSSKQKHVVLVQKPEAKISNTFIRPLKYQH